MASRYIDESIQRFRDSLEGPFIFTFAEESFKHALVEAAAQQLLWTGQPIRVVGSNKSWLSKYLFQGSTAPVPIIGKNSVYWNVGQKIHIHSFEVGLELGSEAGIAEGPSGGNMVIVTFRYDRQLFDFVRAIMDKRMQQRCSPLSMQQDFGSGHPATPQGPTHRQNSIPDLNNPILHAVIEARRPLAHNPFGAIGSERRGSVGDQSDTTWIGEEATPGSPFLTQKGEEFGDELGGGVRLDGLPNLSIIA